MDRRRRGAWNKNRRHGRRGIGNWVAAAVCLAAPVVYAHDNGESGSDHDSCGNDEHPHHFDGFLTAGWADTSTREVLEGDSLPTPKIKVTTKDDRPWECFPNAVKNATVSIAIESKEACTTFLNGNYKITDCPEDEGVGPASSPEDYTPYDEDGGDIFTLPIGDENAWEKDGSKWVTTFPIDQTIQTKSPADETDHPYTDPSGNEEQKDSLRERLGLVIKKGISGRAIMRIDEDAHKIKINILDKDPVIKFAIKRSDTCYPLIYPEDVFYEGADTNILKYVVLTHPDMTPNTKCADIVTYTSEHDVAVTLKSSVDREFLLERIELPDNAEGLEQYFLASEEDLEEPFVHTVTIPAGESVADITEAPKIKDDDLNELDEYFLVHADEISHGDDLESVDSVAYQVTILDNTDDNRPVTVDFKQDQVNLLENELVPTQFSITNPPSYPLNLYFRYLPNSDPPACVAPEGTKLAGNYLALSTELSPAARWEGHSRFKKPESGDAAVEKEAEVKLILHPDPGLPSSYDTGYVHTGYVHNLVGSDYIEYDGPYFECLALSHVESITGQILSETYTPNRDSDEPAQLGMLIIKAIQVRMEFSSTADAVQLADDPDTPEDESLTIRVNELEDGHVDIPFKVKATYGGVNALPYEAERAIKFRAVTSETGERNSATKDKDYDHIGENLVIPAGASETSFSVAVLDDDVAERREYFNVDLVAKDNPRDGFRIVVEESTRFVEIRSPERVLIHVDRKIVEVTEGESTSLSYTIEGIPDSSDLMALDSSVWGTAIGAANDNTECYELLVEQAPKTAIELGYDFSLNLALNYPEGVNTCAGNDALCAGDVEFDNRISFARGMNWNDEVTVPIQGVQDSEAEGTERGRLLAERRGGINTHAVLPHENRTCKDRTEEEGIRQEHLSLRVHDSAAGGLDDFALTIDRIGVARFTGDWSDVANADHYETKYFEHLGPGYNDICWRNEQEVPCEWVVLPTGTLNDGCQIVVVEDDPTTPGDETVLESYELEESYFDTDQCPFPPPGNPQHHGHNIYPGSWYKFQVEAYNASDELIAISNVVSKQSNDLEKVKNVSTEDGIREITVRWPWVNRSGACQDGECPGDAYEVQWKSGTEGWSTERQLTADKREIVVGNLLANVTYTFRVRAITVGRRENRQGLWSDEVTGTSLDDDGQNDFYFELEYDLYQEFESRKEVEICLRLYDRATGQQALEEDRSMLLLVSADGVQPDPAMLGSDYTMPVGRMYTVSETSRGRKDNIGCFRFDIVEDFVSEPDETFEFSVWAEGVDADTSRVIIVDDDATRLSAKCLDAGGNPNPKGCEYTEGDDFKVRLEILDKDDTTGHVAPVTVGTDTPLTVKILDTTTATEGEDYRLTTSNPQIGMGESSEELEFDNINGNFQVELDEYIGLRISAEGLDPIEFHITIKDNDVVEMKIEKVRYETTEGDEAMKISAVMESVNVDVDCLVGFPVQAYLCSRNLTNVQRSVQPATLQPPPEDLNDEAYLACLDRQDGDEYEIPVNSDGPHIASLLTFPKCARKATVLWSAEDDEVVEHIKEEEFQISIHPHRENPAGLRINSTSTVYIFDNDKTTLSFVDDTDGDDYVEYTVNDGSIIDIPYQWSKPTELVRDRDTGEYLNWHMVLDDDDQDADGEASTAVQEERDENGAITQEGDFRYIEDTALQNGRIDIKPFTVRGNLTIQTNEVDEDKVLYLDTYWPEGMLFYDQFVDPEARIKVTIRKQDGTEDQRRPLDGCLSYQHKHDDLECHAKTVDHNPPPPPPPPPPKGCPAGQHEHGNSACHDETDSHDETRPPPLPCPAGQHEHGDISCHDETESHEPTPPPPPPPPEECPDGQHEHGDLSCHNISDSHNPQPPRPPSRSGDRCGYAAGLIGQDGPVWLEGTVLEVDTNTTRPDRFHFVKLDLPTIQPVTEKRPGWNTGLVCLGSGDACKEGTEGVTCDDGDDDCEEIPPCEGADGEAHEDGHLWMMDYDLRWSADDMIQIRWPYGLYYEFQCRHTTDGGTTWEDANCYPSD